MNAFISSDGMCIGTYSWRTVGTHKGGIICSFVDMYTTIILLFRESSKTLCGNIIQNSITMARQLFYVVNSSIIT